LADSSSERLNGQRGGWLGGQCKNVVGGRVRAQGWKASSARCGSAARTPASASGWMCARQLADAFASRRHRSGPLAPSNRV